MTTRPHLRDRRTRFQVHLRLTAREARRLERLAEADLPSVDNYVSTLVVDDLKRARPRAIRDEPDLCRRPVYPVRRWLTAKERKALGRWAEAQGVSMRAYVRGLVARALG